MFTGSVLKTDIANKFKTTFASWGAFVDHIESLDWWAGAGDVDWMGGTRSDAFRYANKGWREQTPKVSSLSRRVADRVVEHSATAYNTEVVYAVTGAAYDPGAYLSGVPECWLAFEQTQAKCGVRIVVDGTLSAGVHKSTKITMGTAICALVMALHSAGHPVTVDLFFGGSGGESCFIRLHDGAVGGVLDIDRLTYAIAHPLPMRGMAHTLWHRGVMPYSRNGHPKETHGSFDLWVGGGHLNDVAKWNDDGEAWVTEQYLKQTSAGFPDGQRSGRS